MTYKLTYSTMFDPPPEMHTRFEAALVEVRAGLGQRHSLHIAGEDIDTGAFKDKRSPIDRDWLLGSFAQANGEHVDLPKRPPGLYARLIENEAQGRVRASRVVP